MTFKRSTLLVLLFASIGSAVQGDPLPPADGAVRVATFNIQELGLKKLRAVDSSGNGSDPQLLAAAAILRTIRPDVVLLNEIDYTGPADSDAPPDASRKAAQGDAGELFVKQYLSNRRDGLERLTYPHRCYLPVNTGVPSGFDFNNDGKTNGPEDGWGFGFYPGQYGMLLLSRVPIDAAKVRTFRKLLWKDVPGALIPDGSGGKPGFYSPEETAVFRLSSKSHWDVPVTLDGRVVHLLCSHPTPPVFDGPEDANGRRNHDELRLWRDYLSDGDAAQWIVDDQGRRGGLPAGESFVIAGDLNADPARFDAGFPVAPIDQLLKHSRVADPLPTSQGGEADGAKVPARFKQNLRFRTSEFGRLDYVLPSRDLTVKRSGVFWPVEGEPLAAEAKLASDHRLVWCDLVLP